MTIRKRYVLQCGPHRLELGDKTLLMGVVNITPDSFSDGGEFFTSDDAIAQGEKLAGEGADIIDIGGESTRPFSEWVSLGPVGICRTYLGFVGNRLLRGSGRKSPQRWRKVRVSDSARLQPEWL